MKPSIGGIVIVVGGPVARNNEDTAPAVVTHVWSDNMINATAFPDMDAPVPVASVQLFGDEAGARAWVAEDPSRSLACFWPARVE